MGFLDSLKGMFGGNKNKSTDASAGMAKPGSSVPPSGGADMGTGAPTPPTAGPTPGAAPTPPAGGADSGAPQAPTTPGANNNPTKPA